VLWLAWKILGKEVKQKIEGLILHHRRWTILNEWWYFANGWPERILLKWKLLLRDLLHHAEERSILGDGSQSSLCWASTDTKTITRGNSKFLEFLQCVGALVFSYTQHINGKKYSEAKLNQNQRFTKEAHLL